MSSPVELDHQARREVTHRVGRTLFVEAGAGTGKTTALVERIVELVLAKDSKRRVPLSAIAAITFTEAAAAELRDKIRTKFEKAQREAQQSGDHPLSALCSEALADADIAAISTLHAFAHRLLSEHPIVVDVPPRVDVIDEVQSQIAFDRRWSDFVDELFDDRDIEEFVVRASILNVGIGSSRAPLRQVAEAFDQNWDRLQNLDLTTPLAAPIDWRGLIAAVEAVLETPDLCRSDDDRMLQNLLEARPTQMRFLETASDSERMRLLAGLKSAKTGHGRRSNWDGRLEEVKGLVDAVKEYVSDVESTVANQTLDLLSRRIARFTLDAAEQRRREGQLEFHDLLVLARQLLREAPEARQALSGRYRVLMLDEFQDTDPIQIELALLLSGTVDGRFTKEWEELTPEAGRLFMVGDPKQSIYRFRRADISLFLAVRKKFEEGLVTLSQNYRTVSPIIEAVNTLFAEVMPETTDAQAKYSPLLATRQPTTVDHRPMVFGGPATKSADELREIEAADVAAIVDDIRRDPSAWPVLDDETKSWRAPELRDITVLLPTRTSLRQLTAAFDAADIPFRADTGTLVYETQEVRDLLAVMSAIDDPSNQIALVSALRSPLYACGDDDLWHWKHGGGEFELGAHIPDELADTPVASAIEHLRTLAERRWWDEPSRLLLRLIDERRAFVLGLGERRARDTWRRLRYVVDQARAFEEAGGGDLRDYLAWTGLQGRDGSKAHEPMLPETDDDAVQIMTIHGAKGLEFPIAIVSGLTTEFRSGRSGVSVLWGDAGTLPEVKVRKDVLTARFEAQNDLEAFMDRPEKDRLLYVALTRARDHLVISGHHNLKLDTDGNPKVNCHGRLLHEFATGTGEALVRRPNSQGALFAGASPSEALDSPSVPGFESPDEWTARRRVLLAAASAPRVRSATALADLGVEASSDPALPVGTGASSGSPQRGRGRPSARIRASGEDEDVPGDDALPPLTFRRGRAGTAIGSAVHAVLQLLDLRDPQPAEITQLVASQAWVESVPEHVETIERSVRSALDAPIVQACRESAHWKELYVAAPVADITIEGYVDLLVDHPDGLVVVDYKTDSVSSEADIDEKLARYALQGAAYAVAVETATGRDVVDVQIVFARPDAPVVRSVDDLGELRRQVNELASH